MATADEYAAWIVANKAKQGTPEFDIVAQAYQQAKAELPAAVGVGNALRELPRQIGLTARYGAEGLADVAGIATEPIRALLNPLLRGAGLPTAPSTRGMVSGAADAIGLPSPQGANERVVADVTRMMAGGAGLAGGAQAVAGAATGPVTKAVTSAMGQNVGAQTASAAGAGAAGGSVREAGGSPLEQFGASLVGGLAGAGATALATKAYDGIASAVKNVMRPKQDMTTVNVTLNQILAENGIDVSAIPAQVMADLAREVKAALDTGKQLNPDVVRRIADYGVVGATPTRGTVTLDPATITQEMNTSKAGMNLSDTKLHVLGNLKNENNKAFIENLNRMGGRSANTDPVTAGSVAMNHIRAADDAAKTTENALYKSARGSDGRALELDRDGFIMDAYNRLGESNKSAFLPEGVKALLEQIRTGKVKLLDGSERPVPFNVDVIDNLKSTIATAQRAAARSPDGGNAVAALSQVREALENTQPRAVGRPVGGSQVVDPAALSAAQGQADNLSADAMGAFDTARRFARERRAWQESSPGVMAALSDEAQPDRFVRDFVIGGTNKGATAHVERLMDEFHNNPAAKTAIKENVVGYLKSKALGGASDEIGNFSQSGYNNALNAIGDRKLALLFTKEEIAQLKALGRVAGYEMVQPKGSAVNNSNTAGGLAGLLDRIANSKLVSRVPFGESAIQGPARNWSAQIGTTRALDAGSAVSKDLPKSKEMLRLEQLLGPGLLLAAPRADGRNDEKRR